MRGSHVLKLPTRTLVQALCKTALNEPSAYCTFQVTGATGHKNMHEKFSNGTHKVLYCFSRAEGELQVKSRPLMSTCPLQAGIASISKSTQGSLEKDATVWLREHLSQMPTLNYIQR